MPYAHNNLFTHNVFKAATVPHSYVYFEEGADSKGNQIFGLIRRNITYKEKGLIVPLYKAIVRTHLEYCIQAWCPYLRKT